MDEKDRHIVSFDDPQNDFAIDVDLPASDITQDVAPFVQKELPKSTTAAGSGAVQGTQPAQAAGGAQAVPQITAETVSEPTSHTQHTDGHHAAPKTKKRKKKSAKKDARYVTKGALAVCMVLTMVVSSALGALMGAVFSNSGSEVTSSDKSDGSHFSISDATGSDLTVAQIIDKNENAVVEIVVSGLTQDMFGQTQIAQGAGSGVIFTEDGYIVTNYHVIQGANTVQVKLHNGESYNATIIGGENENDIAVIKINAKGLTAVEVGDSSKVDVGDLAVAIGNPLGQLGGTATSGIISALDRSLTIDGRTMNLIQTDAAVNPGNSGGGLFNGSGQLIGIVDAKSSGTDIEGLAFAIPINSVTGIINDLIENGKVSAKPAVGITVADVSEENAEYYGLDSAGVYITQVTGDNAQKAGFQAEDRIISFNGEEVKDVNDFIAKVRSCKIGDTVTVVVSRKGQEIEIKTVLEELNTTD